MFWPFSVWINCSGDHKNFVNSHSSASNFKSFSQSLENFFSHSRSKRLAQVSQFLIYLHCTFLNAKTTIFRLHLSQSLIFCIKWKLSKKKTTVVSMSGMFTNVMSWYFWQKATFGGRGVSILDFILYFILDLTSCCGKNFIKAKKTTEPFNLQPLF